MNTDKIYFCSFKMEVIENNLDKLIIPEPQPFTLVRSFSKWYDRYLPKFVLKHLKREIKYTNCREVAGDQNEKNNSINWTISFGGIKGMKEGILWHFIPIKYDRNKSLEIGAAYQPDFNYNTLVYGFWGWFFRTFRIKVSNLQFYRYYGSYWKTIYRRYIK